MKRLTVLFLLVSTVFFTSCMSPKKPKSKQNLRVNFSYEPTTLDPRKGADGVSSTAHFALFEGLTRMTPKSSHEPGVAESIDISDDRLRYTFHLRESVWSDGVPVTAHDFHYAWATMLDPTFPCPNAHLLYPIKNAVEVKEGKLPIEELGIRVIDDRTFEVTLASPTPYFLQLTSFCVFFPVPKHIAETDKFWPDGSKSKVVTNGPFVLREWKHQNYMEFAKNSSFWESESVHLESVYVSIVDNQMTALSMYQNGELDILGSMFTSIPTDCIPTLAQAGSLKSLPFGATTMFSFNNNHPIFANKNIRKAFAYATNRQAIVDNITQFNEIVATGCIAPILKKGRNREFYQDNSKQLAREHLALGLEELGITKADLKKLTLCYTPTSCFHKVAQALQQQWNDTLGTSVKLEEVEFKVLMDKLMRKSYDFSLFMWIVQYDDQMNVLDRFRHPANPKNYPSWHNEQYGKLLTKSAYAEDEFERAQILEEAEELIMDEMPFSCIYHWNNIFMEQDYVSGFYLSAVGSVHLNNVKLEK